MPIGASSNGTSFSSWACGAWSVAMQSIVPSLRPAISAWRSSSERSGGFIFSRVSRVSSRIASVSVRWCGLASHVIRTPRAFASATASTDSRALRCWMWMRPSS